MILYYLANGKILGTSADDEARAFDDNQLTATVDTDPVLAQQILEGWKYTYIDGVVALDVNGKPATVVAAETLAAAVALASAAVALTATAGDQQVAFIKQLMTERGITPK